MKHLFRIVSALLLGLSLADPLLAANFADPTWPCIQRKVDRLSLGLMWPQAVETDAQTQSHDIKALADLLALRRIELKALEQDVARFAEQYDGNPQVIGAVFQNVFESLSSRRTKIIKGIEKFSLSQIALSEKIDSARVAMTRELSLDKPDFDKVDALEEQLDWDQVIYSDRQKSITYLCETPTLLEKRLYGIAQVLQHHIKSNN